MKECQTIDALVTPYVDGELPPADRERVTGHLRVCGPCNRRVAAEQATHDLLARARASTLQQPRASEQLRAACTRIAASASPDAAPQRIAAPAPAPSSRPVPLQGWPSRFAPLAMAAALVLIVASAFVYRMTESSSRLMAAELTADHVKCFAMNSVLGTRQQTPAVEASLVSSFGWPVRLSTIESSGLELVGARPCLYGNGRVAHVMFKHQGQPVSLFMLPNVARAEQLLDVFGHQAAVWGTGTRTYVLVAHEPRAEFDRIVAAVRAATQ